MKKRLYFNKFNEMKFISHLDLLRFLERVLLKGDIPIKYSQGFHPRPKISLGNPISLGTEAYNEVMEIELERDMLNDEILEKIKKVQVNGFEVVKIEDATEKESIVERYKTGVYLITGKIQDIEKIKELLLQEEIIENKEKNGKITKRDLKSKIKKVEIKSENQIEICIENGSPNIYLDLSGVEDSEVKIIKQGHYKN